MANKFLKSERLRSKIEIDKLFKDNNMFFAYPFKVIWNIEKIKTHTSVLISIPKKKIRRSISRNQLKRYIRESYRINKNILKDSTPLKIGILYSSEKNYEFSFLDERIKLILRRLNDINNT